jgi:hypothetical protein
MSRIRIHVNAAGAIRNQRYGFASKDSLVTELLQNARRAGATEIRMLYNEHDGVLCVSDNGCGIADFQKLLTFHESGWDDATRALEQPFGVGFTACLYSSSRCLVRSGRLGVDIDTVAVLAGQAMEVHPLPDCDTVTGTEVVLYGFDNPGLESRLHLSCSGFPIQVVLNGHPLDRPLALSSLDTVPSPVGRVHLAGHKVGKPTRATRVFLQGFQVLEVGCGCPDDNVVHLDPLQYIARLPDRDKLIDEREHRFAISEAVQDCWRRALLEAKCRMSGQEFVERWSAAMAAWDHLDLLNDVDVLPAGVLSEITGYPVQGWDDGSHMRRVMALPSREAIEKGQVKVVSLCEVSHENTAQWMFARAKGYLVYNPGTLHGGHWLHPHVEDLEGETPAVETLGHVTSATFDGRWIWHELRLCEAVRITVHGEAVDIVDEGVFFQDELLIPAHEVRGRVVRQASCYTDDMDRLREEDRDADEDWLGNVISRLRSVDPAETMKSLLRLHQPWTYPVLRQRTFTVAVGDSAADELSVGLVD